MRDEARDHGGRKREGAKCVEEIRLGDEPRSFFFRVNYLRFAAILRLLYPGILSPVSVPLSGNVMWIEDRGDNSVAEVHYGQFTEREIRLVSESVFLNNPAFVSSPRLWRDPCVYRESEERRRDGEGKKRKTGVEETQIGSV